MIMLTKCFVLETKGFEIRDGPAQLVPQMSQNIIALRYFKSFRYDKYLKVISKSFEVNFNNKIENLSILLIYFRYCSLAGLTFKVLNIYKKYSFPST